MSKINKYVKVVNMSKIFSLLIFHVDINWYIFFCLVRQMERILHFSTLASIIREQIDHFTIRSISVSGKSHHSRIYDTRNRFSVSDLPFLARLCVCIMHNGAHHRISISSLYTRRRRAFVSSRRERPYFFSLCQATASLPRLESTSTSTTAARRRRRWRHVCQSENVWLREHVSRLPQVQHTRERDSHNSICDRWRDVGRRRAANLLSMPLCKASSDTLPFLRWRWIIIKASRAIR